MGDRESGQEQNRINNGSWGWRFVMYYIKKKKILLINKLTILKFGDIFLFYSLHLLISLFRLLSKSKNKTR